MNAAQFLQALYGNVPMGWLESTFIAPPDVGLKPKTVVLWRELPLGTVDPAMPKIHEMNRKGYGCYYGVSVRAERKQPEWRVKRKTGEKYWCEYPRGTERDALYLTALYVDVDAKDFGGDLAEARRRVDMVRPSITIATGGGYHGLLLLDEPLALNDDNRGNVKRTLKGIAKHVGSDSSVAELARVLRLPDTVNTKPDRDHARCEVVDHNRLRYRYDDLFVQYAPLIPVSTPHTGGAQFDGDSQSEVVEALRCIPADSIPYGDWIKVMAALYHDFDSSTATSLAEQWSGWCSSPGEVEDKIASFEHSASASTAHVGSIFHIAKQFGYVRQRALTTRNKLTVRDHILHMQGGAS